MHHLHRKNLHARITASKLWYIDPPESQIHALNSVIDEPPILQRTKSTHKYLLSPPHDTLAKAIQAYYLITYSQFTPKKLRKHPIPLDVDITNYMDAQHSNLSSTKHSVLKLTSLYRHQTLLPSYKALYITPNDTSDTMPTPLT